MKKEIEIKICCGTNCYIMGGSKLHLIKHHLPENIADEINIKGENCMEKCNDFTITQKPPLVWVNDVLLENVTIEKLKLYIINLYQNA